jgi:hypothetical protein
MTMKIYARTLAALAGLLLLGSAGALDAQTSDTMTSVPFAFAVGSATLPPDTYRISRLPGHMSAFLIRGRNDGAIVTSQPEGRSQSDATPRLVFHRYGQQYFLREVRLAGNSGFKLPKTRAEIAAAEQIADRSTPEVVVVRARP